MRQTYEVGYLLVFWDSRTAHDHVYSGCLTFYSNLDVQTLRVLLVEAGQFPLVPRATLRLSTLHVRALVNLSFV